MRLFILLSVIFTSALSAEELVNATIVKYELLEPNIISYLSRMIITDEFMRMDDDEDSGNYLLFNRNSGVIESVNHSENLIFTINPYEINISPPFPLKQSRETVPLDDAPKIGDTVPQQFQLSINGEHCQNVVSASGLLPGVVKAWREFRYVLAGEHAATLAYIPADQQFGCDLALNTFYPAWFLDFGLPIQTMEVSGKGMRLTDYVMGQPVASKLFKLPSGYQRYTSE